MTSSRRKEVAPRRAGFALVGQEDGRLKAAGTDAILRLGFTQRIADPRATRLFFDELARQHGIAPLKNLTGSVTRNSSRRSRPSVTDIGMRRLREPLITDDDLVSALMRELAARNISREEVEMWEPAVLSTRISAVEKGPSNSPERQLGDNVKWFVDNKLRPALLVAEEVSGSIYRRGPRPLLEQLHDDVVNRRLRDPLTGVEIKRIVCWMYDRFTRDPKECEEWIATMRACGMHLHESYYGQPPKQLHQAEHEIRAAVAQAAKEVVRLRERVLSEFEKKAKRGEAIAGLWGFGHKRVPREDGRAARYAAVPEEKAAIEHVVDMIFDGVSYRRALVWLNDNGFRNAAGNPWCYVNLKVLLRSARLVGLVRLRVDTDRIHDRAYKGDLFPQELIYDEDEGPDPDFDPPIEPLLPYPRWLRLQEIMDERKPTRGPTTRHFASGFVQCIVCEDPLQAGGHGRGDVVYRCPRRSIKERPMTRAPEPDAERHPSIKDEALDMALEELIFAAYERRPDPADAALAAHLERAREGIDEKIAEANEDIANANHMLKSRTISRRQFDSMVAEANAAITKLKKERRELAGPEQLRKLPDGVELRDLWRDMPMETRQEWRPIVFESVFLDLARARGTSQVMDRLVVTFRPGFEPPESERAAIFGAIDAKVKAAARRPKNSLRLPQVALDALWDLHLQKLAPAQIERRLNAHPDPEVREHDWSHATIPARLKRLCEECGVEYVAYRVDRWKVPFETRELMVELYRSLRSWMAVARQLNHLGITRAHGGEWDSYYVRETLLRHAAEEGITLPVPKRGAHVGRKSFLPEEMRQKIWRMHHVDGKTYNEIARWLTARGIKTPSGTAVWSKATVMYTVHAVDRERKAAARKRKAA
jgi:DNA invertase Pin-like site-specific DNA recombinase